jgi:glycosyltransferase involved in cell wall biosynthesis
MRIAFISSLNGGVGSYTNELVKCLAKHAKQIDLYLFAGSNSIPLPELPKNVKIKVIKKNAFALLIELFKSTNELKKCDIMHINYASFFLPIYIIKKIWNIPYIYTSHGYPVPEFVNFKKKIPRIFESICLKYSSKFADSHITISKYNKNKLQEKYDIIPEVIYHGMNREMFKLDSNIRDATRKKIEVEDEQFLVLFVGAFIQVKNVFTLIESIPYVTKKHHNARFLLIGGGELYDQVIEKIKKMKIEKYILVKKFIPPPHLYNYYYAADCFVLPSIVENFGLVLLEAMNCKLPIIASNNGACPEVVGNAGLLFDPRNSKDLANKIMEIIENKETHKELKQNGLQRAEYFTWKKSAEQYYIKYLEALKE